MMIRCVSQGTFESTHAWLSFSAATSQVRDLSCGLQLCHKCKRPARAVRYFRLRTGEDELESDPQVDQMKQRLKFHFMNPFQKWSYAPKQRFPWKMLLQIVNMILVVVQVQAWCSAGDLFVFRWCTCCCGTLWIGFGLVHVHSCNRLSKCRVIYHLL